MGIVIGETLEDRAQDEVLISLSFKNFKAHLSMDEMYERREIENKELKNLMEEKAEEMVEIKFAHFDIYENIILCEY